MDRGDYGWIEIRVARGDNAREGRGRRTRGDAGVVGDLRSSGKYRAATAVDLFLASLIFEGPPVQVFAIDNDLKAATNAVALVFGSTKSWTVIFLAPLGAPPLDFALLGKASDFLVANGSTAELNLPVLSADLLTFGTKLGDILRGLVCRTRAGAGAGARARAGPVEFRRMDREDQKQKRKIVCEYDVVIQMRATAENKFRLRHCDDATKFCRSSSSFDDNVEQYTSTEMLETRNSYLGRGGRGPDPPVGVGG